MATADELIIKIRADMRDIERKLNGLERESRQTSRTMQQHFQRAAQGINRAFRGIRGPALAATAAGTAFAFMAQRSLEAVEAISDLSTRANVSAEFLQEMRFAINQSGGSARDFDDAISRLNRRFGLFLQNLRTGEGEAGPAAAAFRALGIETRIVNGELTDAEGVFNAAVQGLSEVESAAQRAALASQLFGEDSGPRLVALLDRGVDGIDALREAARAAGVVLENDLVTQAAAASDALEVMQTQVGANFNRAIAQNAQGLISFATVLTNVATAAIRAAAAIGRMFDQSNVDNAGQLERFAGQIRERGFLNPDNITQYGALSVARTYTRGDERDQLMREINRIFETADEMHLPPVWERLEAVFLNAATAASTASEEAQRLQAEINALAATDPGAAAGAVSTAAGDQRGDAAGYFGSLGESATAWAQQADNVKAFEEAGVKAFENVTDSVDDLKIHLDGIADGAIKNLEDSFVDFVRTGRLEITSLVDYMIEQFARLAFQNTIGNALDGLFGSIFGAVLGGPAGAAAGLTSGITGKIAGAPALQVAAAGSQARSVGMASARGVTVSQPITIDARGADAGVEDRLRRMLAEQGPAMQQQTIRATIDAIGRINTARRVQN